jgi:hypothetical protein
MVLVKLSDGIDPSTILYQSMFSYFHYSVTGLLTENYTDYRIIKNLQTQAHGKCLVAVRHKCSFSGRRMEKKHILLES